MMGKGVKRLEKDSLWSHRGHDPVPAHLNSSTNGRAGSPKFLVFRSAKHAVQHGCGPVAPKKGDAPRKGEILDNRVTK
jgi:hypothetical protein